MHASQIRRFLLLLFPIVLLASVGCGDDVTLVPAHGIVKINGQPAADISVQFMPDGMKGAKGPTSTGVTDKAGKFVLKTFEGREGAVPGPHKVILVDLNEDRAPQGQRSRPSRLDARYSVAGPSGLSAEVKKGDTGPIILNVPSGR